MKASALAVRIDVSAYSFLGGRPPTVGVDLIEIGTRKSLKAKFRGGVTPKIPYGTYVLRTSVPEFRSVENEVRLDQPEVSVRIQLPVSMECGRRFAEIGGLIQPLPPDSELWVKVVPVRGNGGAEARVRSDGAFLVSGLDDREYFILVLRQNTIIAARTVQVAGSQRVNVDVGRP